ncbi:B12-binding domain-containing radical SAM protein [Thermodesulfobacteriota bacterium]
MNVLLIKTRIATDIDCSVSTPLGILYLASVAREAGHDVRVLDLGLVRSERLSQTLAHTIRTWPVDLVGLSAMSPESQFLEAVARYTRDAKPSIFMVAGGSHPSSQPSFTLRRTAVDAIIIGEGENTFRSLLSRIDGGGDWKTLAGLGRLEADTPILNPPAVPVHDVNTLPFPAWDLVNFEAYRFWPSMAFQRYRYAAIFTSRGCPYGCIFCHQIFGKKFRQRSPENVLAELELLYKKYDVHNVEILDDIFNFDLDRAKRIIEGIISRFPKMRLAFPNGLRMDRTDREFFRLLKRAGTRLIAVPFETASDELQRSIKKNLDVGKAIEMARVAREEGLYTWGYFMIGLPGETKMQTDLTLDLAGSGIVDHPIVMIATPYSNTEMGDIVGLKTDPESPMDPTAMDHLYGTHNLSEVGIDYVIERRDAIRRKSLLKPRNWWMPLTYFHWLIQWLGMFELTMHVANVILCSIPVVRRIPWLQRWYISRRNAHLQEIAQLLVEKA